MPQKVLANLVSGVVAFGVSDQHHGFSYEALCIKWDDGEGGDRCVGMSDKKIVPGFGMDADGKILAMFVFVYSVGRSVPPTLRYIYDTRVVMV